MDFSKLGPMALACCGCGLPIARDEQATSVMVRVWVEHARQYRDEGPFHANCGKIRNCEVVPDLIGKTAPSEIEAG